MFTEALGKTDDASNLIGQFGVGFYSAFLVADKVTVVTKPPRRALVGERVGQQVHHLGGRVGADRGPGTRLVLSLKEDADKYLDDYTLRDMLKRYSEFISFPIELWAEKTGTTCARPGRGGQGGRGAADEDGTAHDECVGEGNVAKPLDAATQGGDRGGVPEFYKASFKQYDEPMAKVRFSLKGQVEFRAMPSARAPCRGSCRRTCSTTR